MDKMDKHEKLDIIGVKKPTKLDKIGQNGQK